MLSTQVPLVAQIREALCVKGLKLHRDKHGTVPLELRRFGMSYPETHTRAGGPSTWISRCATKVVTRAPWAQQRLARSCVHRRVIKYTEPRKSWRGLAGAGAATLGREVLHCVR